MNIKRLAIAYVTITRKEVTRFIRIWPQTFLPHVVTTTLYFLIFGKIIGSQIAPINGVGYIDYIMPGIVMMAVITGSYNNTVSSFFSAKFQRSIEDLIVSPTPHYVILLGYITGGVVRGIISGILVLIVSMFFIKIKVFSIGMLTLVLLISAIIFSTVGIINGVFARNFDDISWIPSFVLTPLIYLGGVFYSIESLPTTWRKLSLFNPIFYCVDLVRYSILGIKTQDINVSIISSIVLIMVLWIITLKLMTSKLCK